MSGGDRLQVDDREAWLAIDDGADSHFPGLIESDHAVFVGGRRIEWRGDPGGWLRLEPSPGGVEGRCGKRKALPDFCLRCRGTDLHLDGFTGWWRSLGRKGCKTCERGQ